MKNPHSISPYRFLAFALVTVALVRGQARPATPSSSVKDDTAVVLSPFTVDARKDVGFVAATSLAGGRLQSELKDTPVAYSVITGEFIDALKLTNLDDAVRWTVNSNLTPDNGSNRVFANQISGQNGAGYLLTFRGVQGGQQQIDFFPAFYDYDSYNIERFDFARGPNAILFGNGSFGGTPNAVLKQPQFDRAQETVRLQYGSYGSRRGTLDINTPVSDKFAVRTNLLYQNFNTWRDREYDRRSAGSVTAIYQPWKGGEIRASGDVGRFKTNSALATIGDNVSGWDGKTTFSAPVTTLPSNAAALGIARNGSSTSQYPVFVAGQPSLGLMNWANTAVTVGGDATAGVTPVGGTNLPGSSANLAGAPILDAFSRPNVYSLAQSGSSFRIPGRAFTVALDTPNWLENYDNYEVSLSQQLGEHLFLNAAGNYSSGKMTTDYTTVRGLSAVAIDINANLPNGQPNPNFLMPYSEAVRYKNVTNFVAHNYRVDAAAVFDNTRFGSWRFNGELGMQEYSTPRAQYTYVIKDPSVDPRLWASTALVRYRYYWNLPARPEPDLGTINYTNPFSGPSGAVPTGWVLDDVRPGNTSDTLARFKYAQAVANGKVFGGKLDVLAAVRRDWYDLVTMSSLPYNGYGYGASWDAQTLAYKPVGPANYFSLPTSRPTLSNGFPNLAAPFPSYQSDFSTPHVTGSTNTFDVGAVYHLTNWVSAFVDESETYNPPTAAARINGGVFQPLLSRGWDAGLRFNLIGDKLVLTVTQYKAKQTNVALPTGTQSLPFAIPGTLNSIISLTPLDDPDATHINKRGLSPVPFVYSDTATAQTKGTEFELVANPLHGWRLLANLALPQATQSNAFADSREYIAANTATMVQILNDGGVVVNNNVAQVDPTVAVNRFASQTNASAAATAWNNLQAIQANFVTGAQTQLRTPKYTANFFTDYTFHTGLAKGVRVGAGANYYGKEVIGFHGADTIVNPANPAAAMPDAGASPYRPVYRGGYSIYTAVIGYTFKTVHDIPVTIDLNINNLLNYDKPIYYNVAQEPPGGNLSTPARVATPYLYSYLNPRSYSLSVSVRF